MSANTPTPTLSDAQIDDLWLYRPNLHGGDRMLQLRDFARAVIAAALSKATEGAQSDPAATEGKTQ